MSFLLQHSKHNKGNNDSRRGFAQIATLGDRVLPPAQPAASRSGRSQTGQQSSHISSGSNAYQGQQQGQLFCQRPPNYIAPSQKQSSQQQLYPATQKQQQQPLSRKQQANDEKQKNHLAVSMAEGAPPFD
jgi:hypothetical protein